MEKLTSEVSLGSPEQKGEMAKKKELAEADPRLSESQALLYQEYASKLEGKGFSDQAGEAAYAEAQQLINRLKDGNFAWLGIDWDKLALEKAVGLDEAESRMDQAVRLLAEASGHEDIKRKISNFGRTKLPFALAAMILLSGCFGKDQPGAEIQEKVKDEAVSAQMAEEAQLAAKYDFAPGIFEISGRRAGEMMRDWLKNNPELVAKMNGLYVDSAKTTQVVKEKLKNSKIVEVSGQVVIVIIGKDNKAFKVEGSSKGDIVDDNGLADVLHIPGGNLTAYETGKFKLDALEDALAKVAEALKRS